MSSATRSVRADQTQQSVLACLAERIGPQKFNAWFKSTTSLALENEHVKLSVPNPFVASWIENHFLGDLEASVHQAFGEALPLMICVDPSLCAQFRKRQLDTQALQVSRSTTGEARGAATYSGPPLRHRMEDFVVGPGNRLAFTAAMSVAGGERSGFNPLFIHGGCGLGKTHLLQGICNSLSAHNGYSPRWRYVTGEQFTNEFVTAIKRKQVEDFRASYRKLDVLVIDDVHFLAAKRATQEEFLHTFNTIDAAGKQVVMASDTHPKLVGQLNDQLTSRFVSGMVVKIDPPDQATRTKILTQRAAALRVTVAPEVLEYIGAQLRGSVRELEGALVKLAALAGLSRKPITLELANDVLADYLAQTESALTLGDIESIVASYFGVTPADLHSSRRTRTVSLARQTAMMLARRHTTMSFPEIARAMGKNHSSVVLAVQRMEKLLAEKAKCTWMTPAGPRSVMAHKLIETLQAQLP